MRLGLNLAVGLFAAGISALFWPGRAAVAATVYEEDMAFALRELEEACGSFFELKEIDWAAVSAEFAEAAGGVNSDQDHLVLLVRLLARLEDGHASVRPLPKGESVEWPEEPELTGAGMFWCRSGDHILVKNAWDGAADAGVKPGMKVVSVNGVEASEWLGARVAELSDRISFSTPHQAFFYACHWGLGAERGSEWELELRAPRERAERVDVKFRRASRTAQGPAYLPEAEGEVGRAGDGDVNFLVTKDGGWAYIHLRRCPGNLPELVDEALAAVGGAPGLVLDFRGNSGGGFDHEALMGRFIPAGKTLRFAKRYESAGPDPYGGPVVGIVDGTVRSAGETAAAIFKEDGRAYLIGESPTAGMSSSKTTIELPSGLFALYVSVRSNMSRSNGGRGLEGVGTIPHETVAFDPFDLAEEKDTLIARAIEILAEGMPDGAVPYDPADFGWEAAAR